MLATNNDRLATNNDWLAIKREETYQVDVGEEPACNSDTSKIYNRALKYSPLVYQQYNCCYKSLFFVQSQTLQPRTEDWLAP